MRLLHVHVTSSLIHSPSPGRSWLINWPSTICYSIPTRSENSSGLESLDYDLFSRSWQLSPACSVIFNYDHVLRMFRLVVLFYRAALLYLSLHRLPEPQASNRFGVSLFGRGFAITISRAFSRGKPKSFRRRQSPRHAYSLFFWCAVKVVIGFIR